ncbi:conserved Plasmodium protein, unknown function [Plasmodium ovale]|uniref:Uncharacterized protein n=2 Tax=Plasmodium ovale TaxID=36330 RepID=A0A1A8WMI3_PLAOA|nr:conserved Plasmodium protein, unknown function [Plasmodium ovale curtisi]SBS94098.1 conserved Plasmodium protein, unknown function [Plasmodium ovale curtisi]SCP05005.1 conserved Plasmodium protein, unknown function [Plasmodium ovale]
MFKYFIYGLGGSISGWFLRDVVVCMVSNINTTNGILINKFICTKDEFSKSTLNIMKTCFDPLELRKGFNSYHVYLKENNYFVETLYIESWNNIKSMYEYMHSQDNKLNMHHMKNYNIFFSPSLFVLMKRYAGHDSPSYLKGLTP